MEKIEATSGMPPELPSLFASSIYILCLRTKSTVISDGYAAHCQEPWKYSADFEIKFLIS
jgi:hypothetical protein